MPLSAQQGWRLRWRFISILEKRVSELEDGDLGAIRFSGTRQAPESLLCGGSWGHRASKAQPWAPASQAAGWRGAGVPRGGGREAAPACGPVRGWRGGPAPGPRQTSGDGGDRPHSSSVLPQPRVFPIRFASTPKPRWLTPFYR